MTIYNTTWLMDQSDVNAIAAAQQQNFFALQVNGTGNHIVWSTQKPWQEIDVSLVQIYGAIITRETDLSDGSVIKAKSSYPISLGNCYVWNGSNLTLDKFNTCAENAVQMFNNTKETWTFGMTKLDPATQQMNPICADIILRQQPVTYTPLLTIYAKVGRTYKTASIIGDIGSWAKLPIESMNSTFKFDTSASAWAVANP